MKKLICFILCMCTVFQMSGCGTSVGKENNDSETYAEFLSEYNLIIEQINSMNQNTKIVASYIIKIWDEVGPSSASKYIELMEEIPSLEALREEYRSYWLDLDDILVNTGYAPDCWECIEEYQTALKEIEGAQTVIEEEYDSLKNGAGKEYKDAMNALKEYYVESFAYAEFVIEPSGNLLNYSNTVETYESSISSLRKSAELEK